MKVSNTETTSPDPLQWTGSEALAALASRRISAMELVDATLAQAERLAELNLFTAMDPDLVRTQAGRLDERRASGEPVGSLAGLPLIIKDNIDSAALPTTAASTAFVGWQPARDAPVLATLLNAGAILLGKANMHEMAFGVTSNNPVYGPVRNPYHPDMIAGGSSGGTAAAIAARVVTGGLGTDTGGSCRVPAALCGCVGFRPTFGRYPTAGIIPLTLTLDTPGPLARTVDDLIRLDTACAMGPAELAPRPLAGMRLAIPPSAFRDLDQALARVIDAALHALSAAGAILVETDIAHLRRNTLDDREGPLAMANYLRKHGSQRSIIDVFEKVAGAAERNLLLAQLRHAHGYTNAVAEPTTPTTTSTDNKPPTIRHPPADIGSLIESLTSPHMIADDDNVAPMATPTTPSAIIAFINSIAEERRRHLTSVAQFFDAHKLDGVLLPTTPLPARPIGDDNTVELNGQRVPTFTTYIRNTGFGSGAGLPALSVPAGLTDAGLPVGLEIVGRSDADGAVLSLGRAIEERLGQLPAPNLSSLRTGRSFRR